MVAIFAYMYEFNFKDSLRWIKKQNYISKIIDRINAQDEYTKNALKKFSEYANNYIERKINEKEFLK